MNVQIELKILAIAMVLRYVMRGKGVLLVMSHEERPNVNALLLLHHRFWAVLEAALFILCNI